MSRVYGEEENVAQRYIDDKTFRIHYFMIFHFMERPGTILMRLWKNMEVFSFCNNIKLQLFITGKIIFFILVLLLLWKISYLIIEIICYFTCSVFDLNEMC